MEIALDSTISTERLRAISKMAEKGCFRELAIVARDAGTAVERGAAMELL